MLAGLDVSPKKSGNLEYCEMGEIEFFVDLVHEQSVIRNKNKVISVMGFVYAGKHGVVFDGGRQAQKAREGILKRECGQFGIIGKKGEEEKKGVEASAEKFGGEEEVLLELD